MKRHVDTQVVEARVAMPAHVQVVAAKRSQTEYWVVKNNVAGFTSSPLHNLSPQFTVSCAPGLCTLRADARNSLKLRRIVHRLCNLIDCVSKGGLLQKFAIYHDHFPVRYSLTLEETTCLIKLENFLGFKSPIHLRIQHVLEAKALSGTEFELRFTDRDACGTSFKLFFDIKRKLRSKLSKVKFLDCIYPVDER